MFLHLLHIDTFLEEWKERLAFYYDEWNCSCYAYWQLKDKKGNFHTIFLFFQIGYPISREPFFSKD